MIPTHITWQIKRFSNLHIQGRRPNIFLFTTPRSGSTWLTEIIASQPGMKLIDEPLLVSRFTDGRGPLPPTWSSLLPRPDREKELGKYFDDLIHNRIGVGSPRPFHRFHRFLTWRIVFKILRCQDLITWFEQRYQGKIVYLVRHPIPTSLSRQTVERLPLFLSNDEYCARFLTVEQRAFGRKLLDCGTDLEKKVLDWCLQNLPPLRYLDRSRWVCLHYEDLVLEAGRVVSRLARELDLPKLERMHGNINRASGSSRYSDSETREFLKEEHGPSNREYLVNRWRRKVAPDEERSLFEILERFEIDNYSVGQDLPVNRL